MIHLSHDGVLTPFHQASELNESPKTKSDGMEARQRPLSSPLTQVFFVGVNVETICHIYGGGVPESELSLMDEAYLSFSHKVDR